MSCCGPPVQSYPSAKRSGAGGPPIGNPRDRQFRRRQFFSNRLYRVSTLIQDPKSISLREFAILAFVIYGAYHGFFVAAGLYDIVAVRDVTIVCRPGTTALQCLNRHIWISVWALYSWAALVVPWTFIGAVGVFLGEEILRSIRGKVRQ